MYNFCVLNYKPLACLTPRPAAQSGASLMKETRTLALLVAQRRQAQVPLLDFEDTKTKEARLVAALIADAEPTESQLIRTLYEHPSPKTEMAFSKLLTRVTSKLLNHLYFLEQSDPRHMVSRRYQIKCMDLMHKSAILYLEGDTTICCRLARQCLSLAKADGFTCYAIEAAQLLRTLYAQTLQSKRYHAIVLELEGLMVLRRLEEQSEAIYTEFVFNNARTVSALSSSPPPLAPSLERLRQIDLIAQSPNTAAYLYKAQMMYLEQQGDYLGIIVFAQQCEQQLAAGHFNAHRFDSRFNLFMQVFGYLTTQQPQKGLAVVARAEQLFHPSSLNWVYLREKQLLLALLASEFDLARSILEMVKAQPTFARQGHKGHQRWQLFSAYLDFAQPDNITPARRLVLNRLALVMPDFTRDKSGMNVSILVSQVLHFLREGNRDAVVLRVESLRKYRLRYLREPSHQRTRLFLRLLELIADEHFDPQRVTTRATPLLKELDRTPPPSTAFGEVEIIHYPVLWAITVQHLHKLSAVVPAL